MNNLAKLWKPESIFGRPSAITNKLFYRNPTNRQPFRLSSANRTTNDISGAGNIKNPVVGSRYERFTDETAPIIFDVEEERERVRKGHFEHTVRSAGLDLFEGMNLNRK